MKSFLRTAIVLFRTCGIIPPGSSSALESMTALELFRVLESAAVRSGVILWVLDYMGSIDTTKMPLWGAWLFGVVFFAATSAARIWGSGTEVVPAAK